MSGGHPSQEAGAERYALARHGLPLPVSSASVPRAPWLPAAIRGRALAVPARAFSSPPEAPTQGEDEAMDTTNGFAPSPDLGSEREPGLDTDAGLATGPDQDTPSPSRAEHGEDDRADKSFVEATTLQTPTAPARPSAANVQAGQLDPPERSVASSSGRIVAEPSGLATSPSPGRSPVYDAGPRPAPPDANTRHVDPFARPPISPASPADAAPAAVERPVMMRASGTLRSELPGSANTDQPGLVGVRTSDADPRTEDAASFHIAALSLPTAADAPPTPAAPAAMRTLDMGQPPVREDVPRPSAPMQSAARPGTVLSVDAAALAALQQPAARAPRSVRIDRVQLTVQAPASAAPRASSPVGTPVSAPPRSPAQRVRSPWSSYFTRRD